MNAYTNGLAQVAAEGESGCGQRDARPKLIMTFGRGASGKSLWARWLVDEARSRGQVMIVADADLINPSLAPFYPDAISLAGGYEDDIIDWIGRIVGLQREKKANAVVDFGAAAFPLKELTDTLPLTDFLEHQGIEPVAVHLLGRDHGDFAYLQHVEHLIAPAATILVRNAGVVSRGQSVERGLREMMEHPAWEAALRRGAKQVVMPMLDGVQAISALRVGVIDAMRGRPDRRPPLGPVARQLIAVWLREMKESFAPVMETLGCGQEATDPVRVGRH